MGGPIRMEAMRYEMQPIIPIHEPVSFKSVKDSYINEPPHGKVKLLEKFKESCWEDLELYVKDEVLRKELIRGIFIYGEKMKQIGENDANKYVQDIMKDIGEDAFNLMLKVGFMINRKDL